ncbi:hypothetical protein M0R45_000291 [Rubus argutus]|uniref:Reverse transcriptase Ty1/copia-type domain-containing protein n=1 Tax=Rubus argutus TaxID=59490 RepID=A0AAW1VM79_RUBAR
MRMAQYPDTKRHVWLLEALGQGVWNPIYDETFPCGSTYTVPPRVYLLLYVDDIILTGNSEVLILEVKQALQAEFDMKDLGALHYFLGLEIKYLPTGLFCLNTNHLLAAKRILRYVKGSMNHGILFRRGSSLSANSSFHVDLQAYCDADWAGDPNDRKSTTGFVILLNNTPISWCSKKQTAVSRSSTEAEYRSMADTSSEIQWLLHLLTELHIELTQVPTLHCDNISALALAANPVHHSKLKHIEADVHFTREKVKAGTIRLQFVSSKEQLADIFTKGLCSPQHNYLCDSLMMLPYPQAEEGCYGEASRPSVDSYKTNCVGAKSVT